MSSDSEWSAGYFQRYLFLSLTLNSAGQVAVMAAMLVHILSFLSVCDVHLLSPGRHWQDQAVDETADLYLGKLPHGDPHNTTATLWKWLQSHLLPHRQISSAMADSQRVIEGVWKERKKRGRESPLLISPSALCLPLLYFAIVGRGFEVYQCDRGRAFRCGKCCTAL